jgi:acyl-CoA thioesterase FadM
MCRLSPAVPSAVARHGLQPAHGQLGVPRLAGNTRILFFDSVGFTAADFTARQLGPVILEDRLVYRREIRMLEPFTVDFRTVAASSDGRRFKVRNRFTTEAHGLCATVDSVGLDLAGRRSIVPPDDLREAFAGLAHSDDFAVWE